jgi:hypothetical protein
MSRLFDGQTTFGGQTAILYDLFKLWEKCGTASRSLTLSTKVARRFGGLRKEKPVAAPLADHPAQMEIARKAVTGTQHGEKKKVPHSGMPLILLNITLCGIGGSRSENKPLRKVLCGVTILSIFGRKLRLQARPPRLDEMAVGMPEGTLLFAFQRCDEKKINSTSVQTVYPDLPEFVSLTKHDRHS